jgi:glycosyltransferase involved in cell wall biosynthesis
MKICVLTASLNHGGVSVVALDVARGMADRGHQVTVVCAGEKDEIIKQDGYIIHILQNRFKNPVYHFLNIILLIKLIKLLRKIKPDIIHLHNINLQTFSLVSLLLSRSYPMVWTIHDIWPLCMTGWPPVPDCKGMLCQCKSCPTWPGWMARLNRFVKESIYRLIRLHIVSPSQWMASLISSSKLYQNPIHLIYNGVDCLSLSSVNREEIKSCLGIRNNHKVILFCGGKKLAGQLPAERKGWKFLFSAMNTIIKKHPDIRLLYIGDPIDFAYSFPCSFITEADRNQMNKYYSISDLFILPTIADNFPLTILEAMAYSVPIISTNVGGISEMIIPGETGLLCPPRDAAALAEKIDYALSNPEHCMKMAEKSYKRFNEMFTFNRMIDQYEEVLKKTIVDRLKKTGTPGHDKDGY